MSSSRGNSNSIGACPMKRSKIYYLVLKLKFRTSKTAKNLLILSSVARLKTAKFCAFKLKFEKISEIWRGNPPHENNFILTVWKIQLKIFLKVKNCIEIRTWVRTFISSQKPMYECTSMYECTRTCTHIYMLTVCQRTERQNLSRWAV